LSDHTPARPANYRWNFAAFGLDYAMFLIGIGFVSNVTVIPALASRLTSSAVVIGLASTVFSLGWTIPQLAAAHFTKDAPRKKPFFYRTIPVRLTLPAIAVALWAGLSGRPSVMLAVLMVGMFLFAASDGFATLVWFDIMARAVPVDRRGRLMGMAQFIGGVGGIGVGGLVTLILDRWTFPESYAILFGCASVGIGISSIGTLSIREPEPEESPSDGDVRQRRWVSTVARNRDYRRLMASRLLVGMAGLATPFYVVHAADAMMLPESAIGAFFVANTVGGLASSLFLGILSERRGPRFTIHLSSAIGVAGPLSVLAVELLGGEGTGWAYPLAFFAVGVTRSASMLGFTNYTLEIAPGPLRPAYVGLANTVMGSMALVPAVGGWLLQATSYSVLFTAAGALTLVGFMLTLTLRPSNEIAAEFAPS
jgi:MFS family permease